ncbi:integrin-linked protein kinase-like [Haliotis rufescens]|uniref:integrin-linked protein kinase-like n=1 Tax=Haliotis rufescens TaxID=6454 RepID=UPI00201EEB4D|nr:integrin-linked protein kinase-like [Haliotis rufescens]
MTLYADHRDNVLKAACFGGNVEIVKYVLSQNVLGINSRGAYRQTPLMEAASRGHHDVFDVLIEAKADVPLVDEHGNNILHLACLYGQEEMVKYLLSKDYADIDTKNSRGKTAATIAK